MDDNQKKTPGGRNDNRRANNRPRRENNAGAPAAGRSSNAQLKFDPHFVSAPEATPLRSTRKAPVPQQDPQFVQPRTAQSARQGGQNAQNAQNTRGDRNNNRAAQPRNDRPARSSRNGRGSDPKQAASNGQNGQNGQSNPQNRGRSNNAGAAPLGVGRAPRKPEQAGSRSRGRNTAKDEDPGLVLISRRPPQQKFSNFEEYMTAHGGATAPIEDHSEEV